MQGKNVHVNKEKEGEGEREGMSINLDLPGLPSFVASAARDCGLVLGGREIRGFQCNGCNVRGCARVVEVEDCQNER